MTNQSNALTPTQRKAYGYSHGQCLKNFLLGVAYYKIIPRTLCIPLLRSYHTNASFSCSRSSSEDLPTRIPSSQWQHLRLSSQHAHLFPRLCVTIGFPHILSTRCIRIQHMCDTLSHDLLLHTFTGASTNNTGESTPRLFLQ